MLFCRLFPVLVYLSSSSGIGDDDVTSIFDELGANSKKIAVTKDDGTTQLYVEIEKWDSGNEKAWLWVSLLGWEISSTVDTVIYIYYDSAKDDNTAYIGDPSDAVVHNVWDNDFKMVQHMEEAGGNIVDSTSNDNDGIVNGNPTYGAIGKIGEAIDFDGAGDYYQILDPGVSDFDVTDNFLVEFWIKLNAVGVRQGLFTKYTSDASRAYLLQLYADNKIIWNVYQNNVGTGDARSTTALVAGTWFYIAAGKRDGTAYVYVNGVEEGSDVTAAMTTNDNPVKIGRWYRSAVAIYDLNGILDEIRFSDGARTLAWVKASYESERDNFVTYGSEEEISPPPANPLIGKPIISPDMVRKAKIR